MFYWQRFTPLMADAPVSGGGATKAAPVSGGGATKQEPTENKVELGQQSVSGSANTAVSAPHIVQYPKPPKRDDGRWLALSSVIGNIIGKLSSQKVLKQAKSAESEWKDVMRKMKELADREYDRVTPLRDKAQAKMDELDDRSEIDTQRGDTEYDYGEKMKPCIDNNMDALCQLAECGYEPDYDGIYTRVAADAAEAEKKEADKICRVNNRYNTGWNCNVRGLLAIATQSAVIGQTNKLREEERLNKWKYDYERKKDVFATLETARQNRQSRAQSYTNTAADRRLNQYIRYTADADNSLKMGADLLASHGQNAAWLAESLRKTAKESMADWGTLATMIAGLVLMWNSRASEAKSTDGSCNAPQEKSPIDALF